MDYPKIIEVSAYGNENMGYLNVGSLHNGVPFDIKRVFWTVGTPTDVSRGRHAHYETEMVLFCITGEIKVKTISKNGEELLFTLIGKSNKGLYIPKLVWHEMWYSTKDTTQLVVASTYYNESDYIRNFPDFLSIIQKN